MTNRSVLVALLLLGAASPVFAQALPKAPLTASSPTPDDRARHWLVLVDDQNYAQSWSEAAKAFQNRRKAAAWSTEATTTRVPLGAVASRGLKSIDLSRGNSAVIRYNSVFAHKAAAVETVTLGFENGSWSVTDYSVN